MTVPPDWQPRAAILAESLSAAGAVRDEAWHAAFQATPRHLFIPRYWEQDSYGSPTTLVDGADAKHRNVWLDAIYQDRTLVTRWTESTATGPEIRVITESAPAPSTLAVLLDRLDIDNGQRILEVGTGSGYGTALLSARVGADNVSSLGNDRGEVEHAAQALARAGHHPHVEVANGFNGLRSRAPYDRIIATRAVGHIPPAWIAQLAPGGRIVLPLTFGRAVAVLDKIDGGEAVGVIDGASLDLMTLSTADQPVSAMNARLDQLVGSATALHTGTTDIDPRELEDDDVLLWASLHLPGMEVLHALDNPQGRSIGTIVFAAEDRASVSHRATDNQLFQVVQQGRRPWDHVEAAIRAFRRAGRPARERLGIGARADGAAQRMWLDEPNSAYGWPMPGAP